MSRYLLDTHAALFWWRDSPRLGQAARHVIAQAEAEIFVSSASAWEVATKHRLNKLEDIGDPVVRFPLLMRRHGFRELQVTIRHGLEAGALSGLHRDPFDRLIAAQGLIEDLIIITRDREFAAFGCKVLW